VVEREAEGAACGARSQGTGRCRLLMHALAVAPVFNIHSKGQNADSIGLDWDLCHIAALTNFSANGRIDIEFKSRVLRSLSILCTSVPRRVPDMPPLAKESLAMKGELFSREAQRRDADRRQPWRCTALHRFRYRTPATWSPSINYTSRPLRGTRPSLCPVFLSHWRRPSGVDSIYGQGSQLVACSANSSRSGEI
jgi:hypothetical protein